jgi:hypothetical protein
VAAMAADTGADLLPIRAADSMVAEGSAVVAEASMGAADFTAADTDKVQTGIRVEEPGCFGIRVPFSTPLFGNRHQPICNRLGGLRMSLCKRRSGHCG